METMELLQYLRFREVQKILDELLRQRLIDPVMYLSLIHIFYRSIFKGIQKRQRGGIYSDA